MPPTFRCPYTQGVTEEPGYYGDGDDGVHRPRSRRWIYGAVTAGVVVVATVATLLVSGRFLPGRDEPEASATSGSPASGDSAQSAGCAVLGDFPDSADVCAREAADAKRRPRLDGAPLTEAYAAADKIRPVLTLFSACSPVDSEACMRGPVSRAPNEDDIDTVVSQLTKAGFTAVARVARGSDPAPHGSLLFAVEVGVQSCVIGYMREVPFGYGSSLAMTGRLPDGHCLDV